MQECKHCADRHFVIDVVEAGISALRSFIQPAESDAPTEAKSAALLAGAQMGGRGAGVQPCANKVAVSEEDCA